MIARQRLLYVASRWPWPVESGRKRMIDQALSIASDRFDVELAAFVGRGEVVQPQTRYNAHLLTRPGVGEFVGNCLASPGRSLQSNLFASRESEGGLAAILERFRPDVVVLDMLRLAPYGRIVRSVVPDARLVLDMDDLLSNRYRQMRRRREEGILGAFTSGMPAPVRALARLAPLPILAFEEWAIGRSERRALDDHDAVVLVSGSEANALRTMTGGDDRIHAVPPAIETALAPERDFKSGVRFVFLGNEQYRPNAEALRLLEPVAREVLAEAVPGRPVSFVACGRRDDAIVTPSISRHGFVDSLDDFLGADAVMVAPIMTGTGIKTKVLDAMARGVPVIGTPKAFEGLDVVHNRHVIQCQDIESLRRIVGSIAATGGWDAALANVGREGRRLIMEKHALGKVSAALMAALGEVEVASVSRASA